MPPIEYRLDSLPDSWPVIILLDAMWNDKPGPHGFVRMAWMVWFPVGDTDGELVYTSAEADMELPRGSNDLKPKKRYTPYCEGAVW